MTNELKNNTGTRIGSMIVDHMAMTFIAMIFFIPGMVSGFMSAFEISHEPTNMDLLGEYKYLALIGFALYFCKDSINGRSIGKRATKLQVVNYKDGTVASPLKCTVRNLFIVVWPIEVIVTLASPSRRIGDFVAGTKVVPYTLEREQPKVNYTQIGIALILAYLFAAIVLILPLEGLKAKVESHSVRYVERSLNESAARETEQRYATQMDSYLTADVVVYDQIEDGEDLKYVSVILHLKENYLETTEDFDYIKSITLPLLLRQFPEGTFVGQIKYVYREPGQLNIETLPLDWRE
ncbi:RDD family protein [Phaeocystidibacter marisrubri]|uniref:RDD family protein n=1 Tax=Phaeocystidibacter marisrubri TaxID=1577780 RepID=A0A6L3ZIK8_9FLAO|nr:RDD family protein [Phaeocystidibacter marisrubri]KAB2817667.1 RDD family protein [Phaeocystidibacter marisrubri]GGH74207.1 hypothetical protein GCM10011318_19940 [Phaeocystidibacter marisrubri]